MKKSVKFLSPLLILLILLSTCIVGSAKGYEPENFTVDADAALLLYMGERETTTVYEKNAAKRRSPASLTKVATVATALAKGVDLNATTTVSSTAIKALDGTGSVMANLLIGEEVTVRQLLYLIMLHSAGDACNVLAELVAGSIDAFVVMMNEWVKSIGCTDTNFMNPTGIDGDDHYTTANDLAKITQAALISPDFSKIATTTTYKMEATNKSKERTFTHRNSMLHSGTGYYYAPAQGIKTGTTTKAGYCVITIAVKDGYKYLCIIMGGVLKDYTKDGLEDNGAFFDAKYLLQWAFSSFRMKELVKKNTVIASIPVKNAKDTDVVQLVPKQGTSALVPSTLDPSTVIYNLKSDVPKELSAPVLTDKVLGTADIVYANEVVATIELVAATEVKRSLPLFLFNSIKDLMGIVFVKIIIGLIVLFILFYIWLTISYNKKKKKKKMRAVKDHRKM